MKISSNGIKLAHYLPAMNNLNTPGLINLVDGNFLAQAAGDKFIYGEYEAKTGSIILNGEDSYRTLSYIESPEPESEIKGAYIDTSICSTPTTAIEIDAMAFSTRSYYGGTVDKSYNCTVGGNWTNYFYCSGAPQLGIGSTSVQGVRTVLKQDGVDCYRDGVKVATATNTLPNDTATIILCARRNTGAGINDVGKVRIFACRLWENGKLVKDFIPVIKNETTYGLYDLVNNEFNEPLSSAGFTGKFTGKGYTSEFTALYLGDTDPEHAPFSVTNTGKLKATNANLEGQITATSGIIGGFEVDSTQLKSNNEKLLLNGADGEITAKSGEIGGFQIAENGFIKPGHLSITEESAFFEAANFSLNNDVIIYNDNDNIRDEAYTSYITTTGTRHFEIKNNGGAGIRFNATKKDQQIQQNLILTMENDVTTEGTVNKPIKVYHLKISYSVSNNGVLDQP
jgi:hypothetical protein